ncbi:MAG: DNA polymerase-3 subunit delta [Gammaproteobacteria bacterium]
MQLRPEQLAAHLGNALLPLYIISGEEPLQREESIDAIRAAARAQQFDERTTYHVDRRFDWSELGGFGDALSLFAARRIVEVRAPSKLDDAGRKALITWCERLPEDVLMILVLGYRVDRKMAQAKWFAAVERAGAHLSVSPVDAAQMPRWIARRAQQADLQLDDDACSLLAERAEGNLLAGAQEVDKLALLYRGEAVSVEKVLAATADSARYDAFDLVEACFTGDAPRTVRIVQALKDEGLRLPEVLGPLAWAMRSAAELATAMRDGRSLDQAMGPRHGAWRMATRKRAMQQVLQRHSAARWSRMLKRASLIDRAAKGDQGRMNWRARGELQQAWSDLESLSLLLAGVSLVSTRPKAPSPV